LFVYLPSQVTIFSHTQLPLFTSLLLKYTPAHGYFTVMLFPQFLLFFVVSKHVLFPRTPAAYARSVILGKVPLKVLSSEN
jgi:hypothetical protein